MDTTTSRIRPTTTGAHARWLAGGFVLAFAVPFLFADLLTLPRDLYYGVYALLAVGFFLGWVRATGENLPEMVRRRPLLTVVLAISAAAVLTLVVVATEPPSTGSDGLILAWDVVWRGVIYGAVDGLLLSSFPILAVFAAARGSRLRSRRGGTIVVGAAAMVASLLMTAVYHLGYSDFRSDKLARPVAGDVVWSLPTLLTQNPIGAPIAHAGLHIAAVLHSPQTETFLPPHDQPAAPVAPDGQAGRP